MMSTRVTSFSIDNKESTPTNPNTNDEGRHHRGLTVTMQTTTRYEYTDGLKRPPTSHWRSMLWEILTISLLIALRSLYVLFPISTVMIALISFAVCLAP